MDLENKLVENYKQRAAVYDKRMQWVNDLNCIEPLICNPFGGGRSLELCAGTGVVSKYLFALGWNVTLLDSSLDMLLLSGLDNRVIGDAHKLPFEDSSFDLVVCRQGLQYTDIPCVFYEVQRVLRGQFRIGHITKEENDSYNFWENYFQLASPQRRHIFEPGQMKDMAIKSGFKVLSECTYKQQDDYLGPLLHLKDSEIESLLKLIYDTPEAFKKLYNVIFFEQNILYNNRWEFLTLCK